MRKQKRKIMKGKFYFLSIFAMPYNLDHVRVLVVDDMRPMLQLVVDILKSFGFSDIHTAENGQQAFELYCQIKPDFIITDWLMDPVDGLQLTELIRQSPNSPNQFVPIIMMTGFSSRLRVETARDKGITEFMVKPFSAKDLYARIFQVIEKPRQFVSIDEFFGPDRRRRRINDYEGPRRRDEDPNAPDTTPLQDEAKKILKDLQQDARKIGQD